MSEMFAEFWHHLRDWGAFDTWIVVTGALAAMSCALPGAWLLLRRQSLLGDALSHSILPGIVIAYLGLHWLEKSGWVSPLSGWRHLAIFLGAALSGVVSAILTELIQRWGRLDRSAAIGVVFTSMFAFGLLLIRMFADQTHVDPGCVLYGNLETSASVGFSRDLPVPQAAILNGVMLAINGFLVTISFRALRLSTFDPGYATSLGLNADVIQVVLMGVTAATLVAAFESVGAILVVAMLIIPAATARLLTDRLPTLLVLSLIVAAASAGIGHVMALTLPPMVFSRLGYPEVHDASIAGMMAVAAGGLFVAAIICGPRHGALRRIMDSYRLRYRIAAEDLLAALYRRDEKLTAAEAATLDRISLGAAGRNWLQWLVQTRLQRHGLLTADTDAGIQLTGMGRSVARDLIRSHRLWEAYMARHFHLPFDHLHATAEEVEHFLSPEMQSELAHELNQPDVDPHGQSIPGT